MMYYSLYMNSMVVRFIKKFNPYFYTSFICIFCIKFLGQISLKGAFSVYIKDHKLLFGKDHPMFTHQDTYSTLTQLGLIFFFTIIDFFLFFSRYLTIIHLFTDLFAFNGGIKEK